MAIVNSLGRMAMAFLMVLGIGCGRARSSSAPAWNNQRDVAYGSSSLQALDVYQPPGRTGATPRPAIVFIHGGGWTGGDKDDFKFLADYFAQQGYVTFSMNYRMVLSPELRYPVPYDDAQRAMRFIRTHAAGFGIDPRRVGALGASAGGHLAGLLGTTDSRDNSVPGLASASSRPTCVVDLYGPMDLVTPLPTKPKDLDWLARNLIGDTRKNAPQLYREASPIAHIDSHTAPFLIFHGTQDTTVPQAQSQAFDTALKAKGIESELVIFPNEGHGFMVEANYVIFAQKALAFFDRHLK